MDEEQKGHESPGCPSISNSLSGSINRVEREMTLLAFSGPIFRAITGRSSFVRGDLDGMVQAGSLSKDWHEEFRIPASLVLDVYLRFVTEILISRFRRDFTNLFRKLDEICCIHLVTG